MQRSAHRRSLSTGRRGGVNRAPAGHYPAMGARTLTGAVGMARRLLPRDAWRAGVVEDQLHGAVKAILAAGLAWELGRRVGPARVAYFAPITALVAIHPTVARSVRETAYYGASLLAGVLLAMGVDLLIGSSVVGVVVVVGVGVLLGGLRWFGRTGVNIAFWALLVLLVGGSSLMSYLGERLPEAALGLGVGILVNVVVLPRVRLRPAGRGLHRLRGDLAKVAEAMASDLAESWPPRDPPWERQDAELQRIAAESRAALQLASDSMRFNPRARRRGRRPIEREDRQVLDGLERITTAMRAITRTLAAARRQEDASAALDDDFRPAYAALLAGVADPIRVYGTARDASGPRAALPGIERELRDLEEVVGRGRREHTRSWLSEALLLVELDQIRTELAEPRSDEGVEASNRGVATACRL